MGKRISLLKITRGTDLEPERRLIQYQTCTAPAESLVPKAGIAGFQLSPHLFRTTHGAAHGAERERKREELAPSQHQGAGSALRTCKNPGSGLKDAQSRNALGHSQQDVDRVIQKSG